MRDDGGKKEQGCNNRHAPDYAPAPVRMRRPEMPRERERNQQSDDQPTVVQSDFDAEDSAHFSPVCLLTGNYPAPTAFAHRRARPGTGTSPRRADRFRDRPKTLLRPLANCILREGMAAFVLPSFGSHFFISHFADLFLQIQLGASSASRGCLIVLCQLEAPFDGLPVNVREECLEIHRALRRFVIEQEDSILPDV